jgi:hypothetical protein
MEEYLCFMVDLEAVLYVDGGANLERRSVFVIISAAVISMSEIANTLFYQSSSI